MNFRISSTIPEEARFELLSKSIRKKRYIDVKSLLLEEKLDVDKYRDENGNTLLMGACSTNDLRMVKLLLSMGASTAARSTSGKTALMHCCDSYFFMASEKYKCVFEVHPTCDKVLKYLVQFANADISATNPQDYSMTAQNYATMNGFTEIAKFLGEYAETRKSKLINSLARDLPASIHMSQNHILEASGMQNVGLRQQNSEVYNK